MLNADDIEFLSRPLFAMITVAPRGGRWPAPRPVWFEVVDAQSIQLFSFASTPRVARVEEEPRASVVVAAPVGEPERWISFEGAASVHPDGAYELADRLARRYYADSFDEHRDVLAEWSRADLVRIVVAAERIQRFTV